MCYSHRLVGLCMQNKYLERNTKLNRTRKNPNWQEANQLAMHKHGQGVELGATKKQLQLVAKAGFEPGAAEFKSSALNHLTMLAPYSALLFPFSAMLPPYSAILFSSSWPCCLPTQPWCLPTQPWCLPTQPCCLPT